MTAAKRLKCTRNKREHSATALKRRTLDRFGGGVQCGFRILEKLSVFWLWFWRWQQAPNYSPA
jgi:hypothetical protein